MKILKNNQKTLYGVKHKLYSVIYSTKGFYSYYSSVFWNDNIGNFFYKTKRKSKLLNRYTLPLVSIIYQIFKFSIVYPVFGLLYPFKMYFDGGYNFVRDTAWYENVRYFNWCNIFMIIGFVIWMFLNFYIIN